MELPIFLSCLFSISFPPVLQTKTWRISKEIRDDDGRATHARTTGETAGQPPHYASIFISLGHPLISLI